MSEDRGALMAAEIAEQPMALARLLTPESIERAQKLERTDWIASSHNLVGDLHHMVQILFNLVNCSAYSGLHLEYGLQEFPGNMILFRFGEHCQHFVRPGCHIQGVGIKDLEFEFNAKGVGSALFKRNLLHHSPECPFLPR